MGKFVTVVTLNNDSSYCIIGMVFVIHSKKKFIGGLYVTNLYDNWEPHMETYKKLVSVGVSG